MVDHGDAACGRFRGVCPRSWTAKRATIAPPSGRRHWSFTVPFAVTVDIAMGALPWRWAEVLPRGQARTPVRQDCVGLIAVPPRHFQEVLKRRKCSGAWSKSRLVRKDPQISRSWFSQGICSPSGLSGLVALRPRPL